MAQPTIRRTTIIGLGGTGALTILHIKKMLYQFYGAIPLAVRFLVLDTDSRLPQGLRVSLKGERWGLATIDEKEFLYLSVRNPLDVISSSETIKRWWPEGLPVKALTHGAAAYRARGKLAFHAHAEEVEEAFQKIADAIIAQALGEEMREQQRLSLVEGAGVDVYIIGSLAGGTGSGCFIDTAFLFRKILPETEHKVCGFLFLPWIFRGLPATHRVEMNAYAGLKELDHYMSFNYMRKQPSFTFGKTPFSADRPPYDVVNLVDGRNERGIRIKGSGTSAGIKNLCELIGMGIALNIGNVGQEAECALDNLYGYITAQQDRDWGGKDPHYSSFGASAVIYPMEKHYNRLYSTYAFVLIDKAIQAIRKEGALSIDEKQLQDDVMHFSTENRLNEDNNHIIDDLIDPGRVDVTLPLPTGIDSATALKSYADDERERIESDVGRELDLTLSQKGKTAREQLETALKEKELTYGPVYSLRFGEKIQARMEGYKDKRLEEIQETETEFKTSREDADRFFTDTVQRLGLKAVVFRKKSKLYQNYLDQMSYIIEQWMEIERRRKALEIYGDLINVIKEYGERLNLKEMEKNLSLVRRMVETEYFRTTLVKPVFGEHAIVVYPKEIIIRSKDKKKGEKKSFIGSAEDFEKLGVPVELKDFLEKSGLAFEELSKMDARDLKEKIVTYAQEKIRFVKDTTIENVLLEDIEREEEKKEKLMYWLRDASERAVPFWYHKAAANFAAMMEDIFIIGTGDAHTTPFARMEYPEARYSPTFTSTQDPYKLYYFKFKAPLPAYLLENIKDYRREYLDISLSHTPHVEKEIELTLPDLFPVNRENELGFRIYTLALSASVIKSDSLTNSHYIEDVRCLEPGEDRIELGGMRWSVFEELKEDRRKALREKLLTILREEIQESPDKVMDGLKGYYNEIKNVFEKREGSMAIGDEILIYEQIKLLDEFFRKGESVESLLG